MQTATRELTRCQARLRRSPGAALLVLFLLLGGAGCRAVPTTPRVIYLEGSGWFTSASSVRSGLRSAGYPGAFETFTWTTFLGAGADHLVGARSPARARRLAQRIEEIRRHNPGGRIDLIALSAGTSVVIGALERLPDGVAVDNVVLLSSSLSARRNLCPALRHVRRRLYATCSEQDVILRNLPVTADGQTAPAAGCRGFVLPDGLPLRDERLYARVVNLPWRPAYLAYGWNGGHVRVTTADFIRSVIAPRLLAEEPFPLDRPMVPGRAPGGHHRGG